MGNGRIMLLNVEPDEPLHRGERVELIQVEPVVLERSPGRLDHRVRKANLDLGQDALEESKAEKSVDVPIHVLDAGIGDHRGWALRQIESFGGLDKHGTG